MFNRILIAVDFSPTWEHFLRYVTALFPEAFYYLVTVVDSSKFIGRASMLYEEYVVELAENTLQRMEKVLMKRGALYDIRLETGRVTDKVLDIIRAEKIQLLVIGSHYATGSTRFKLGGIARDILSNSNIPVLIMNSLADPPLNPKILNPTSGSLYSQKATSLAIKLTKELEGSITCLYLQDSDFAKYQLHLNREIEGLNIPLVCKQAQANPLESILQELTEHDLLVGSRGYRGLKYSFRFLIKDFALDHLVRDTISLGQKPILLVCD